MKQLLILATIWFSTAIAFASPASWKIVPQSEVCMVTNVHFGRPQIPVAAAGKTYYGCCENCKTTLTTDAQSRVAEDPVSKKKINKADAVIASNRDGAVLYFENEKSFKKFLSQNGAKK